MGGKWLLHFNISYFLDALWSSTSRPQAISNVLVWGASGGIGSMAVQICKAVGAKAIGIVSDDKIPL